MTGSHHESVTCPHCNGTGEIERPECSVKGCEEKMTMMFSDGNNWICPIHHTMVV